MLMRPAVVAAFSSFSEGFEGKVPWMYLDVLGLVTVAIGNLIDAPGATAPPSFVLDLPFVHRDGSRAGREEIAAEWRVVKHHPTAARHGHRVLEDVTHLRLTEEGIETVVSRKRDEMAKELVRRFACFSSWPADAQLGTLSMAWACGPWFQFPRLAAALLAGDFDAAAGECTIREAGNPGVVPRNVANRRLFRNAALVTRRGLDRDTLFYPGDASSEPAPEPIGRIEGPVVTSHREAIQAEVERHRRGEG